MFCGFAALFFGTAAAQTFAPIGGETAVVAPLTGDQVFPSAAFGSAGGFIVWQDARMDGRGQGIGVQRVSRTLLPDGDPFRVNQRVAGHQMHPSVALLSDGGAVVSWDGGLTGGSDIFARFLRPDGAFLTGDLQVNPAIVAGRTNHLATVRGYKANRLRTLRFRLSDSYRVTREKSTGPAVAALSDGGSIVAYSGVRRVQTNWMEVIQLVKSSRGRSYTNDIPQKFSARQDWMQDVFFQRFDSRGRKVGGEVLVNENVRYNQRDASVAALPGGGFVVAFVSESGILNVPNVSFSAGRAIKGADVDVLVRMFDAAGRPLGHEFKVNTAERLCASPVVSAMADGRFTVAWAQRDGYRTNGWDIQARVISAAGSPESEAFRVNTFIRGDQFAPKIASVGLNQMIVWTSQAQDGSREGVFGQALSGGLPTGSELAVNSSVDSAQIHPSVVGDGAGCFVTLWSTFNVGSSFDLNSQMYATVQPAGVDLAALAAGSSGQFTAPAGAGTPAGSIAGGAGVTATDAGLRLTWSGPVGKLRLNWTATAGVRYQIQTSPDLKTWSNLGLPHAAVAAGDSLGIDVGGTAGFFRVMRVP